MDWYITTSHHMEETDKEVGIFGMGFLLLNTDEEGGVFGIWALNTQTLKKEKRKKQRGVPQRYRNLWIFGNVSFRITVAGFFRV